MTLFSQVWWLMHCNPIYLQRQRLGITLFEVNQGKKVRTHLNHKEKDLGSGWPGHKYETLSQK
jgi:hypothetical protein